MDQLAVLGVAIGPAMAVAFLAGAICSAITGFVELMSVVALVFAPLFVR